MGKIVDSLNRIIVAHGGNTVDGTKADVVRAYIKQEEGYEIPSSYKTVGEVLERYADIEEGIAKVTISCKSGTTAVTPTSITVKKGSTVGSGDAVTPGTDGKYGCKQGTYNYSITASGYQNATGTFSVSASDVATGSKTVEVALTAVENNG